MVIENLLGRTIEVKTKKGTRIFDVGYRYVHENPQEERFFLPVDEDKSKSISNQDGVIVVARHIGLPEPKSGVLFIVPETVFIAHPWRVDLLTPINRIDLPMRPKIEFYEGFAGRWTNQ